MAWKPIPKEIEIFTPKERAYFSGHKYKFAPLLCGSAEEVEENTVILTFAQVERKIRNRKLTKPMFMDFHTFADNEE